jgi:pimeloyl-ACP methyl ester carboxylesterase
MNIIFIPGLLCTNQVWGKTNDLRKKYLYHDADVTSYDTIDGMSKKIMEELPSGDCVIIGISMGGYVALDVASRRPANLKKLVLINTTAKSVNVDTLLERERAIKIAELGKLDSILKLSEGFCYFNPKKEWITIEKSMAFEIGAAAYIRQQRAIISRKDYSDVLSNIVAETLIITSKEDRILPYQDSIFLAEKIPHSSLFLLNKCGHLATLEKGEIVSAVIDQFIRS